MPRIFVLAALSVVACQSAGSQLPDAPGGDAPGGCVPTCEARTCGTDPTCGTSCGTCSLGTHCNAVGSCVADACMPDCGIRECGLDPVCNQVSCGTCPTATPYCAPAGTCASNVASISITPTAENLVVGRATWFTAQVTLNTTTDETVTWTVMESGGGTITPTGVYRAPSVAGTYHVIATSNADPTQTVSAVVTVSAPNVRVIVGPSYATVAPGARICLRSVIADIDDQRVTWSAVTSGSIGTDGCFVAPTAAGVYEVEARSAVDTTKSARATVKVLTGIVGLDPNAYSPLHVGSASHHFELYGTDANRQSFVPTASVDEGAAGGAAVGYKLDYFAAFPNGGFRTAYDAPLSPGLYHVSTSRMNDPRVKMTYPMALGQLSTFRPLAAILPAAITDVRMTKLLDGKVLISGGHENAATASKQLSVFDPATLGVVNSLLVVERRYHTATLLDDGRVLIAGGERDTPATTKLDHAEVYDPTTGTSSAVAPMAVARSEHFAVKLASGQVLLGGGGSPTAELFDPATNTFTLLNDTVEPHPGKQAIRMPDGRVLLAMGHTSGDFVSQTITVYDPTAMTFTFKTSCPVGQSHLHIVQLDATRFLFVGRGVVQVYNDATGQCTRPGLFDRIPAFQNAAVRLADGRVALIGGTYGDYVYTGNFDGVAEVNVYDPVAETITPLASLDVPRRLTNDFHQYGEAYADGAIVLDDGRVLVAGGMSLTHPNTFTRLNSLELWMP